MLDLTGIMFSSCLMLFVIVRAVQLDRSMPWFVRISRKADAPRPSPQPPSQPQPSWRSGRTPPQPGWRRG